MKAAISGTLFLAFAVRGAKVTPIEKVIDLLGELSSKIEEEGKDEAKEYDKFACFCKQEATDKMETLAKDQEKIEKLSAEQGELETKIASLNSEDSSLLKAISDDEESMKEKHDKRQQDHAEYLAQSAATTKAIESARAAIDAVQAALDSKFQSLLLKRGYHGDLDTHLLQFKNDPKVLEKLPAADSMVSLLSKAVVSKRESGEAKGVTKDIMEKMRELYQTFKADLEQLETDESNAQHAYDKQILAMKNQDKYAAKEVSGNMQTIDASSSAQSDVKMDRAEVTKDYATDEKYLNDLTAQCEKKAKQFHQRSDMRANELHQIAIAVETLKKGTAAMIQRAHEPKKTRVRQPKLPVAASFLQLRRQSHKEVALHRARAYLAEAVKKTHSSALSSLALRMQVVADPFATIRGYIKDLLGHLKDNELVEDTCKKDMEKATEGVNSAEAKVEECNAKLTTLTADKAALQAQIDDSNKEISGLFKAINERTELRQEEADENRKSIAEADLAIEAVKTALGALEDFYDKASEANTEEGEYGGASASSTGIIGMLEVCQSDFERAQEQTKDDEDDSKFEFDEFVAGANQDKADKTEMINVAETTMAETQANILLQTEDLDSGKKLLATAADKLKALKAMCDKKKGSYEDRAAQRRKEIEALKEASGLLDALD